MPWLDEESRLALDADEPAVQEFLASVGGRLSRPTASGPAGQNDGVRVLELHPASAPRETFWPQLRWVRYPYEPASVTFLDGESGIPGRPQAWPLIAGYRVPNDICMPFTAEGYIAHPEWRTGPHAWIVTGNPFLRVAMQLQDDLDQRYQGRAA